MGFVFVHLLCCFVWGVKFGNVKHFVMFDTLDPFGILGNRGCLEIVHILKHDKMRMLKMLHLDISCFGNVGSVDILGLLVV